MLPPRVAEVPVHPSRNKRRVLLDERPIQAKLLAKLRLDLGRRTRRDQTRQRIASDMQQQEDQADDAEHDGDRMTIRLQR